MAQGTALSTAFVRISADLTGFQAEVESGVAEVGDTIATGIQAGVAKGGEELNALSADVADVGVKAGAEIGDGLAAGVEAGVAKSAAALDTLAADATAAAGETAAAGAEASDSMSKGFLSGGMSKLLGGALFAGIGADLIEHLAGAATKTAESLQVTETMLGLTAQQAEHLSLIGAAAGLSLSQLDKMAARLDKNLQTATGGTASYAKALDSLGINAQSFASSSIADKATALATAIASGHVPAAQLTKDLTALNIPTKALTDAKTYGQILTVIEGGLKTTATTGSTFARTLTENGISIEAFAAEKFPDQLNTIADAFAKTTNKAQGTALVMAAFGRQGIQLLPLITNLASLNKLSGELKLPTLNTENTEKAGMEFNLLKQYIELVAEDLATKLVPYVVAAATALITFVQPIQQGIEDLITFAQSSENAKVALEAIGAVVASVALIMFSVPLAIAAAIAALVELYEKSETFRDIVNAAFADVKTAVTDTIVFLEAEWAKWGDTITADTQEAWGDIQTIVRDTIQDVSSIISTTVAIVEAIWGRFGGAITSVLETAFNELKTIVSDSLQEIQDVIEIVTDVIEGKWGAAWGALENLVSTAFSEIVTVIKDEVSIFLTEAEALGSAILDGVEAGLKDLGKEALKGLEAIPGALAQITTVAYQDAFKVGEEMAQGVLDGLGSLADDIKNKAVGLLKEGWSAAGKALHGSGDFQFTKEAVGAPMGQAIVTGIDNALNGSGGKSLAKSAGDTLKQQMELALSQNAALIEQAGELLGKSTVQGVINGVAGTQQTLGQQLKAALNTALIPALAQQANSALIKQAGELIGTNAVQSIVNGVIGKQQSMATQLKAAITQAIQPALAVEANSALIKQASSLIGANAAQSVVDGVVGKQQTVSQQLQAALTAAIQPALAEQAAAPAIHAAASQIGEKAAQAVVDGVVGKSVSLETQIKTALSQAVSQAAQQAAQAAASKAQSAFSTAFQQIEAPIDSAFEAATAKAVSDMQVTVQGAFDSFQYGGTAGLTTPAQAQLDALQEAHDAAQQQAQLAADEAQEALDQASGTAAQILADQQAVAEDQYQIQVSALQKQADAENTAADTQLTSAQTAYQAQQSALEDAMNQRLSALETGLENGNISAQSGMTQLDAILTDPQYGIDANTAAYALGGQVYTGLNAGLQPVFALVTQLQDDLAKVATSQSALSSSAGGGGAPAISTSTPIFASENGDPGLALKQALNETVVPALAAQTDVIKKTAAATTVTINSTTSHAAQTARDALR